MLARKAIGVLAFATGALVIINCSSPPIGDEGGNIDNDTSTPAPSHTAPSNSGNTTTPPPPATSSDAGAADPPRPDAGSADASPPPPPPPPSNGPCQTLNPCCAQLDSLVDRLACTGAVFAGNSNGCLAAEALYCNNPSGVFGGSGGTNCQTLRSCCSSNPYITDDPQCTDDAYANDDTTCADDLYFYQTDEWGDCQ